MPDMALTVKAGCCLCLPPFPRRVVELLPRTRATTAYCVAALTTWPPYWQQLHMIAWLQTLDTALFRLVNQSFTNPVFDWLMPKLGGHWLFAPVLVALWLFLLCKGGRRGRLVVLFLVLGIALADGLVCSAVRRAVDRPRPSVAVAGAHCRVECPPDSSMPSSQAAVWFAAAMVCCIYYRRSGYVLAPLAAACAFSRVYDGVHYPGDVLAGAILGAGCAAA